MEGWGEGWWASGVRSEPPTGDEVSRVWQVPVPSLPAGVHEAGKAVEKADAIFSQERDPRFAEMFAGIGACKCPDGGQRGCVWVHGRCLARERHRPASRGARTQMGAPTDGAGVGGPVLSPPQCPPPPLTPAWLLPHPSPGAAHV